MTASAPRPLIIVTGYLGAGKTTLVRQFIPALDAIGKRGLLIMNEVGDLNLDGAVLRDTALEQRELLGGCVCCDLRGDLYHAIREGLHTHNPDYIILETSGLAEPADVIDAATAPKLRGVVEVTDVVTVVDCANLERSLKLGPLARNQAAFASALILNKVDCITEQELESVKHRAQEFAAKAQILPCSHGEVETQRVIPNALRLLQTSTPGRAEWPEESADDAQHHEHHEHHEHRKFFALTFALPEAVASDMILPTLKSLPENAFRVKGFVRVTNEAHPWIFQRVGDIPAQATPFSLEGTDIPIGMVVIGPHLDADGICAKLEPLGAILQHSTN